jgi:hypothetical protein
VCSRLHAWRGRCSGADNELGDLIVAVSDTITTPDGKQLEVLGHLGRGTFGQVLKVRTEDNVVFALKIIRNRQAFRRQAETELELVRSTPPPPDTAENRAAAPPPPCRPASLRVRTCTPLAPARSAATITAPAPTADD